MTQLEIGQLAPDFTLPGVTMRGADAQHRLFSLREHRGSPLVLAFYPADASPGCTSQLCNYQNELSGFEELGAEVWAISRQSAASHESFARRSKLTFPLLADERGDVVDAYGVGLFGVGVRRSIFIIDAGGVLRWKHVALVGVTYQSARTIREQLALLPGSPGLDASAAS
ncbi:peroxiredoxin [Microcella alkalica]|uniref:thioredoxin-dependent peroxiredoxin n=1 Tax=Microcella alkalica TaxID=355930 RepID=A0A839E9V7_9MICO|nr:peroxiredoxin [Microcella alkalica]MBA8846538.1 peroxiredoxin Q/BCP [Microcella alkalica]